MGKYCLLILMFATFSAVGQSPYSVKSKEFSLPLSFDVVGHGVDLAPLEFHYDMESSDGRQLKMGNLNFDAQGFFIQFLPLTKASSYFQKLLPPESAKESIFLFRWPDKIISTGLLEMISRTGRVLWSHKIDEKRRLQWDAQLESWRQTLLRSRVSREEIAKQPLFKISYGLRNAQKQTPFEGLQEPFRFCLSYVEEAGHTRICTAQYEVLQQKGQVRLSLFPATEGPPRVILMNEDGKLSNTIQVTPDQPIQFFAELRSGYTYEFVANPDKIRIVDIVQDKNSDQASITTESDVSPLADSVLLNKRETPEWVEWVGWQQTIGDFRQYWRTKIPTKDSFLMIPGKGGGAFRQKFSISKLPKEESRPYLSRRTIKGTYVDGAPIRGRKLANVVVTSKQNSVSIDGGSREDFVWNFGAKVQGENNRSYLMVKDGENVFPAYHEIYKGFAGEISSRASVIAGIDETGKIKFTIMGEVALNYWYESVLGWENYLFSRQRWGTSVKAFKSVTDLEIENNSKTKPSTKSTLMVYTGELKYRLNQGLWGRDETWGLIAGYQHVTYDVFNAQMGGVGAFWARSMPKVFDDLIAWVGFLDYPKWVDMEFIYYPVSLAKETELGRAGAGNWSLNFHGQIMFTKRFFGEAGFGLKQYDFGLSKAVSSKSPNFSIMTSYGTVGLGFKF